MMDWASYESDGIGRCELAAEDIVAALEQEKTLSLATCAGNHVSIRLMSHVNVGLTVYFQTGAHYLKARQIKANPNVAFSVGAYQIEGVAEFIGHPLDEANRFFMEKYKAKHLTHAERWSALPDQVVVKVDIAMARQWKYADGKPMIAIWADQDKR